MKFDLYNFPVAMQGLHNSLAASMGGMLSCTYKSLFWHTNLHTVLHTGSTLLWFQINVKRFFSGKDLSFKTELTNRWKVSEMFFNIFRNLIMFLNAENIFAGLGKCSFQKKATFLRYFAFFSKEHNILVEKYVLFNNQE